MKDIVIGILGGGQLAKMTAQEARKLGLDVVVLDPDPLCPASSVAKVIVGDFKKKEDILKIVDVADIITYDIERVDTTYLHKVKHKVFPSPEILDIIQDKFEQKRFLAKNNLPVPKFKEKFSGEFPCVWRARKGGYDGRGVKIIRSEKEIKNELLEVPFYVEEYVEIQKEISIIVSRSKNGEIAVFPPVEMVFVPERNILDMLIAPARIDTAEKVKEIAIRSVQALDGVGVFGIEMFISKDGRILINEIAPRPHNSGHCTIEACATSQFEQHIRAILGLPLGMTDLLIPAVMINLLGEDGYYGKPIYENIEEAMKIPGVYVHIYSKKTTFPYRKMGHITIIDKDIEKAIEKAKKVKQLVKVKGTEFRKSKFSIN